MFALNYKLTSYYSFLLQLAELFDTKPVGEKLSIPAGVGQGFYKVFSFNEGLEALVYEVKFWEEVVLIRQKNEQEFYILAFDEISVAGTAKVNIGVEAPAEATGRNAALYLTSFFYNVEHILDKNTQIKGVRILLTVSWMRKYLQLTEKENVLQHYINLKNLGVWQMPVDAELRALLHDVISNPEIPLLFYQNKLLQIIEKFFSWLYSQMQTYNNTAVISRSDIEHAQKVEAILTNDITVVPPTIKELSRTIAISESKLKKIFKMVYGLPPYEYYQKQRMQKARVMLLSGNYSIKDVGYTLGYANLSNFTLAFKKEFAELPSELTKNRTK